MAVTQITPPSAIRIGETEHGRGVFATQAIAKDEVIEICPILELGPDDASGLLDDYVVNLGDDSGGTALMLGYGSLYNHSDDPNAEYLLEAEDAYSFCAIRDIAAGEQITISYGEDWWTTRADREDL